MYHDKIAKDVSSFLIEWNFPQPIMVSVWNFGQYREGSV